MHFRDHHLLQIKKSFELQHLPLDVYLNRYFRDHPALGSKDRKFLGEAIYTLIRWKGLFEYLNNDLANPLEYVDRLEIPAHIRFSFPPELYHLLVEAYGEEKTREICLASNTKAPVTIRVNSLKIGREELIDRWKERYVLEKCEHSSLGIRFKERQNFYLFEEFKEGLFEVQDEGSQLVSQLVQAELKDQILDYCAGAGGKALAIAPLLKGTGQIYLHDIRKSALDEARKRLNRAGIQNAQFNIHPQHYKKMDWVLVDVPCSGIGTLRRNPDIKWRFSTQRLPLTIEEQRKIFSEALRYLKPTGKVVYATCSILPQENQQQAQFFCQKHNLTILKEFQSLPSQDGMDGFYGVVMQLKSALC